jgi:hypothetical protein
MKKWLVLSLCLIGIWSCSMSDDVVIQYRYEFLPVESYDFPDHFIFGQTYTLNFYYRKPTTCHNYSGFYFETDENTRTVAIHSLVLNSANCQPIADDAPPSIAPMSFRVVQHGQYIFKLYKGKDNDENIIYEEVIVQVH